MVMSIPTLSFAMLIFFALINEKSQSVKLFRGSNFWLYNPERLGQGPPFSHPHLDLGGRSFNGKTGVEEAQRSFKKLF